MNNVTETHDKSWKEIQDENGKLKEIIKKMANEIFMDYFPRFASPEAVIDRFADTSQVACCFVPSKEIDNCREEKMFCKGCYYYRKG